MYTCDAGTLGRRRENELCSFREVKDIHNARKMIVCAGAGIDLCGSVSESAEAAVCG